jgi:predicted O-methyltransferase YrrM
MHAMPASGLYDRLVIPENRRSTSISREQGDYIFDFLNGQAVGRTLETGFAYGCSAAYILSATKAQHIAIDGYQEGYNNLGLANVARLGLADRLQFIRLPSHVALPQLLADGVAVDFVFIDGGHKFEEIFLDWYYGGLLLNKHGHVMFDDTWLEATQMVADFLRMNRQDYREMPVPVANLCLFQKIGADTSDWRMFRPFGPQRQGGTGKDA